MKKIVFLVILFVSTLFSSDFEYISKSLFNPDEINTLSSLSFQIIDGSIKVDKLGGFADGEYRLDEWEIEKIDDTLYNVQLIFQKKKGYMKYSHTELIGVFYDGVQFVIKYQNNLHKYKINQNQLSVDDNHFHKHNQEIIFEKNNMKLKFQLF